MAVNNFENSALEIIKNRLFWSPFEKIINPPRNSYMISMSEWLRYTSFHKDFGPLNLAQTYKFCVSLQRILTEPSLKQLKIFQITPNRECDLANSAYLICAFQLIVLNRDASEVLGAFADVNLIPFRDASKGEPIHELTLPDCIYGLEKAVKLGWFSLSKFDLINYEYREKLENGDFNWIIPDKILAFSCPALIPKDEDGNKLYTVDEYIPIFKRLGITTIIRLNKPKYDRKLFVRNGFEHFELYFPDGSVPNHEIVNTFLHILNCTNGPVAVHCKSGLGRTGTLIGCFAIQQYQFTAEEFIAWCRIARPGSVLGPQQLFLGQFQKLVENKESNHDFHKAFMNLDTIQGKDRGQGKDLIKCKKIALGNKRVRKLSITSMAHIKIKKIIKPVLSTKYLFRK